MEGTSDDEVSASANSDAESLDRITILYEHVLGYRGNSGHKQGWFCMGSVSRLNAPPSTNLFGPEPEHHVPGEGADPGDEEEVEKPVFVSDAVRALGLLRIFDSQQEEPTLTEPGIARTLEHLRCGLLGQRLIRLEQNQQQLTGILSGLKSPSPLLRVVHLILLKLGTIRPLASCSGTVNLIHIEQRYRRPI